MADEEEKSADQKKPDSVFGFLIALVVVSVVAVGAGWFVVEQLAATQISDDMKETHSVKDGSQGEETEHEEEEGKHVGTSVIVLDPLIVDLQNSQRSWIRLELAIVAYAEAELDDEENKLRLANDIAAFVRTLSIQQISGPSGNLHLREDLLDRARLSTDGFVEEVLITSMVVE